MPTYVFEDVESGERVERVIPMAKAPKYDQVLVCEGRKLRRVVEDAFQVTRPFKPYITRVPPKRMPGFKHTPEGHCVVETRKQEVDYARRTNMKWD